MLKGRSATRLGAAIGVSASLLVVASAGAAVTASRIPAELATAMEAPTGGAALPTSPPNGNPLGFATTPVAPFPRVGPTFAVLTTGDATQADVPGGNDSADDGGEQVAGRGDTALDVSTLQIPITVPVGGPNCVSFDFRFLSEEYPVYITSQFNDAFIAELVPGTGASTWTTSGATITGLQNNFATDTNGLPVTIKSTGPTSMSPAEAAGTPYGGATAPLQARTPVTPGDYTLYLSVFDQSDNILDTTVFVDNFRIFAAPGGCARGSIALGPAVAITGPAPGGTVQTATPTLTGTANGPGNVTVRIYQGDVATGEPVQQLTAARSGTSWSATTAALADGQYTAQATQPGADGINGLSGATTFTVDTSQVQSQPSQQLPPSDRDGDGIPDSQDTNDGSRPPVPGKSVQVRVVSGDVYIKLPKGSSARTLGGPKGFIPLKGAANIPVGSQLDTEDGRVALTSAADTGGAKVQTSDFYQGIFEVKQTVPKKKPKKPAPLVTDLVLKGQIARSECGPVKGARAAATAAKKKGPKSVLGQLWGNGKGKFRTSGKYSSATVRGTIWLTQDRCDGTLTKVTRGTVLVRDLRRKKTVTVKAGHSYLARAARAASKAARKK